MRWALQYFNEKYLQNRYLKLRIAVIHTYYIQFWSLFRFRLHSQNWLCSIWQSIQIGFILSYVVLFSSPNNQSSKFFVQVVEKGRHYISCSKLWMYMCVCVFLIPINTTIPLTVITWKWCYILYTPTSKLNKSHNDSIEFSQILYSIKIQVISR